LGGELDYAETITVLASRSVIEGKAMTPVQPHRSQASIIALEVPLSLPQALIHWIIKSKIIRLPFAATPPPFRLPVS
jgi:hypothetical protein